MTRKSPTIPVLACLLAAAAAGPAAATEIGQAAPGFTLTDSRGRQHSLSDFKGKYVVLEWINFECPFVKKHYDSGNMQGLQKKFTGKEVVWLTICSSAPGKQGHYTPEEINRREEKLGAAPTAYLLDEDGKVGTLYGAKTTPHMFVINPQQGLIYMGAIDSDPSYNQEDIKDAENYVEAALEAAMAGEPVAKTTAKPYGCSVKY